MQVVGEYSFLDARGVGELERLPLGEAAAALAAGDALAPTWRPAPNQDGTVHESSADVLVRGRQLLSLLETQYVGENIVVIRWGRGGASCGAAGGPWGPCDAVGAVLPALMAVPAAAAGRSWPRVRAR